MHQSAGFQFKNLIGRFRISYTEDDRVRGILLPAQTKLWSSIGPFPAADAAKAFATAFDPEKDVKSEPLDLKKSYSKVVLPPATDNKSPAGQPAKVGEAPAKPPMEGKPGDAAVGVSKACDNTQSDSRPEQASQGCRNLRRR